MVTTVYLDESGYTGPDLVSSNQPVLVMASHSIPEQTCGELFSECFPNKLSKEFKYSDIAGSKGAQRAFIDLILRIPNFEQSVILIATDKKYALVAKMVTNIMEPVYDRLGIPIIAMRAHIALAEFGYHAIPNLVGRQFFDDLLSRYQALSRKSNPTAYADFFEFVRSAQVPDVVGNYLHRLLQYDRLYTEDDLPPSHDNDVLSSSVVDSLDLWSQRLEEPFDAIADESSRLLADKDLIDIFAAPREETVDVEFPNRIMRLPFLHRKIRLENSQQYKGLQMADLLAGACRQVVARMISSTTPSAFEKKLVPYMAVASHYPVTADPEVGQYIKSDPARALAQLP